MSRGLVFSDIAGLTLLRNEIVSSGQKSFSAPKLLQLIDKIISGVTRRMIEPDADELAELVSVNLSSAYSAIARSHSSVPSQISTDEDVIEFSDPEEEDEASSSSETPPPPKKKVAPKQIKRK